MTGPATSRIGPDVPTDRPPCPILRGMSTQAEPARRGSSLRPHPAGAAGPGRPPPAGGADGPRDGCRRGAGGPPAARDRPRRGHRAGRARRSSAGTTTWSTGSATRGTRRPASRSPQGLLDAGTVWFTLAVRGAARRTPLGLRGRRRRRRLPRSRWSSGLLGNRVLRGSVLSWLPWAVQFALYPAYLAYGGWDGQGSRHAPDRGDDRAGRAARRRRPRAAGPARASSPTTRTACATCRCGSPCAPAPRGCSCWRGVLHRRGGRRRMLRCRAGRRPDLTAGARLCAMQPRRSLALTARRARPHRAGPDVVRVRLRHRPVLHARQRRQRPRRRRRRAGRRGRVHRARLGHLRRVALQQLTDGGRRRSPSSAPTEGGDVTAAEFEPVEIAAGRWSTSPSRRPSIQVTGEFEAGDFVEVALGFDNGERTVDRGPGRRQPRLLRGPRRRAAARSEETASGSESSH